jgi:hypothetical protein
MRIKRTNTGGLAFIRTKQLWCFNFRVPIKILGSCTAPVLSNVRTVLAELRRQGVACELRDLVCVWKNRWTVRPTADTEQCDQLQILSDWKQFEFSAASEWRNLKKNTVKNWNSEILELRAEISSRRRKVQGSDYGGRILLGDNTDRGAVMLWPIGFQGVRVWISTGLFFMYTYMFI